MHPPVSRNTSGDVVGEVSESEGGAMWVFEAAADGFGEAIAGLGGAK